MDADQGQRRQLIAGALVLATVFFVWGAVAERAGSHSEQSAAHVETATSTTMEKQGGAEGPGAHDAPSTASEGDAHGAGNSATARSENAVAHTETSVENRTVLGINLESWWVIALAAAVSLALAALVLISRDRWPFVAVIVLVVAFVVLEIAEIQHQYEERRSGLVALAALAGLTHLFVILAAGRELTALRARVRRGQHAMSGTHDHGSNG